jgi:hypothetical protein
MKSTADRRLLNKSHVHSYQQQAVAIYINICIMWHKGTSEYFPYCQLHHDTQSHCNMLHSYKQHRPAFYRVIKKPLWWSQYNTVTFKVSPASLQTFIDTRLTLTPSVIPNSNYVIMISDWYCLKYFCLFFCTAIMRCTETFWSLCIGRAIYCMQGRIVFSFDLCLAGSSEKKNEQQ